MNVSVSNLILLQLWSNEAYFLADTNYFKDLPHKSAN